jgi:hypothetical protein
MSLRIYVYMCIHVCLGMVWVLTLWLLGLRTAPRMTASDWQEVLCVLCAVCTLAYTIAY